MYYGISVPLQSPFYTCTLFTCHFLYYDVLHVYIFRFFTMTISVVHLYGYQKLTDQEESYIQVPLSSAALLFTIQYCGPDLFQLKFSSKGLNKEDCFRISGDSLKNIKHEFDTKEEQDCMLPVIRQTNDVWIRSGLCGTIRYIVAQAHKVKPNENLDDLLVSRYIYNINSRIFFELLLLVIRLNLFKSHL